MNVSQRFWIGVGLSSIALVAAGVYVFSDRLLTFFFQPTSSQLPQVSSGAAGQGGSQKTSLPAADDSQSGAPQIVLEDLEIPWEVVFLPDNSLLVSERPGQLVHLMSQDSNQERARIQVAGVRHVGEGGLLGLALHPDFAESSLVYLYLTSQNNGVVTNRVERYRFSAEASALSERQVILENIPGAANHDGGRIAFGPDGMLYVTTGDAQQESLSQDTRSLAGKILRLTPEGEVPSDNPFGNLVYAYGLRNPQGLAWDSSGQLWATDHGPSGVQSGFDEVNLIVAGGNYGWPLVRGDQARAGMIAPVMHSGSTETWAPAAVAVVGDQLLFVGLRGASVYVAEIVGDELENLRAYYRSEFGRLRTLTVDPSGQAVILGTSNTDGRGASRAGDDRLVRIPAANFAE
jgi:glucose/arabinose dehydrogenase